MFAPQQAAAEPSSPNYIPVISTREDSRLIVINDNCILTLDAVLSVAGIGKVLSSRGHELYSLYNSEGGVICQFEGTGLMQRTVNQIDEITRKHAGRAKELDGNRSRLDALERMVDIVWYTPGMPGANQAEEDFEARRASLVSSRVPRNHPRETHGIGEGAEGGSLEDDKEEVLRLDIAERRQSPGLGSDIDIHQVARAEARET